MTTWHVHREAVHIYTDGKLVAVIPRAEFGQLVYRLAEAMR